MPRADARRTRRRARGEAGATHVLEAVLIASIMLSAVAYVSTFDQPSSGTIEARGGLTQQARDALDILYDTPIAATSDLRNLGDNALSAYINACLNQDCAPLADALARLAPEGAAYALYVSNGYSTYPVYVVGEPTGEAVSATRTFEPRWSSSFVATAASNVSSEEALLVYSLPIFNSNPVTPGGSQLLVRAYGTRSDGSSYVLVAGQSTQAYAATDFTASAVSLTFVDAAGNPLAVHDATALTMSGGTLTRAPVPFRVRVAETQGVAIPAGAEVAIHLPRGWVGAADGQPNPGWAVTASAPDANGTYTGSTIRARLNASLTGAKELRFNATYMGDVLDHYSFQATLSNGASAVASMIVTADKHASKPSLATPTLLLSVPKPMGRGADTDWTVAVQIPKDRSSDVQALQKTVRITRVEITEEDGNPIFGDITPLNAENGTFLDGNSQIVWTGDVTLDDDRLLNLSFRVSASGTAGPGGGESLFVPPITFDGWSGRLLTKSGPGFYRGAILPETADYAGYDPSLTGGSRTVRSDATYRTTSLPGSTDYTTNNLTVLQDALYGSYVGVEQRRVPTGGEAVFNADVQSVLFALAEAGQKAGVTLRIYPPWSGDERPVWYYEESLDSEVLVGEATQIVVLDINGDGIPDPVIGTSNGRVFALNGLTGSRLQGNSFTVPIPEAAQQLKTVPRISQMTLWERDGETLIVVGTDKNGEGIFVLDDDLAKRYEFTLNNDVLALDASTDINGDGKRDLLVAKSVQDGATSAALVYALQPGATNGPLDPIRPASSPALDPDAFYQAAGTPSVLLGLPRVGTTGAGPGLAVSVQTTLDPGISVSPDPNGGVQIDQGSTSTPRAGLQALDAKGNPTSTFFGAPLSVARTYDYGGDTVTDVLAGSSSGYVVLENGTALTQPIYSYLMQQYGKVLSADARTGAEAYLLTSDGAVLMTDDGWQTMQCPLKTALGCGDAYHAVGAKAITSNSSSHFWLVGAANMIIKTSTPDESELLQRPYQGMRRWIPEPATFVPQKNGAPYLFATRTHTLNDIWMRDPVGYIVGSKCIQLGCTEGFLMATNDSGASWKVLTNDDGLEGPGGGAVTADLLRVRNGPDGTAWVVGTNGTILRSRANDSGTFYQLATNVTGTLRDIACQPGNPYRCIAVGDAGLALESRNALSASPTWTQLTNGLPTDRALNSIGFAEADRIYVGATNMVLASFGNANWTTLPLNYLQMDGTTVATIGDGTGYVFGGSATGRIWSLHDFLPSAQAVTTSLAGRLPLEAAKITGVQVVTSNLTKGLGSIAISASTNGSDWTLMDGPSQDETDAYASPRNYSWPLKAFNPASSGRDLRLWINMSIPGESTIASPFLRDMVLRVTYQRADATAGETTFWFDFNATTERDAALTTASWDTTVRALHLPYVDEYWTRNVTGAVKDLQTGYQVTGDAKQDVWVGTGKILAENSPDQLLYAPTPTAVVGGDNRTYLLDGSNGSIAARSKVLDGQVRQIRLSDVNGDGTPEQAFVTTYNDSALTSRLYALHAATLVELWNITLAGEDPSDLEATRFTSADAGAFVGAVGFANGVKAGGHVWAINASTQQSQWAIVPDDLGKYHFSVPIGENAYFGAYVAEVEVSWNETIVDTNGVATSALRSARFYDHFMVTPPDLLSPPSPVYTARLVMWLRDWG